MRNAFEVAIERCVGPILDRIGTRTTVVETQGNSTQYVIYDKATNEQIGDGVLIVGDGMFGTEKYFQKSNLRTSIFRQK